METNVRKYKYLLNLLLILGTVIFIDGLLNIFKIPSLGTLVIYPLSNALLPNDLALAVKHSYPSSWIYIFVCSVFFSKFISYIEQKNVADVNDSTIQLTNIQNKKKFTIHTITYWCIALIISTTISITAYSFDSFIKYTILLTLAYLPPYILFLSPLPKTIKIVLEIIAFTITTIILLVFSYFLKNIVLPISDGNFNSFGCDSVVGKNIFTNSLKFHDCANTLPWYESKISDDEAKNFLHQKCIETYGETNKECYLNIPIERKTYINDFYHFSVDYPLSLPTVVKGEWMVEYERGVDGVGYIFFGPISKDNGYPENYLWTITITDIAKMNTYSRNVESEIKDFVYRAGRYSTVNEQHREDITINNNPATLVSIETTQGQNQYTLREVYIKKNGFLFIIRDSWNQKTGSEFDTFYNSLKFN